ncbi:MAG: FAD-binding oxidoreductase [Deltaproteobacteria bacterium]|nr:FAD-binding oxidoreductase [Deltaproteobacteria bacterium]
MDEKIIKELKEILGSDELFFEKEDLKPFSYDATERTYYPEIAVMPTKTEQVAGVLKIANREKIPVTPQGGRTGLSGGALPIKGGIALSLLRMNRIIEIDLNNLIAIVEPGLNPVELQQEVNKVGLFYPPDRGDKRLDIRLRSCFTHRGDYTYWKKTVQGCGRL